MDVAVIAYHSGDDYQNSYGIARLNYYGVTGFPTVKFDGILSQVGAGGNMYPSYLAKYNSRISVPSSYNIDVEGSNNGLIDYELEITVEQVAPGIDDPRLHVVVTETDIPENWGGLTEVNFVERLMAPNQNGTTLDFTGGSTQEITINFNCDPAWVNENCEVVIFLQNNSTKEVLQGIKRELSEFETTNVNDAAVLGVMAPQMVCDDSFIPKVEIANYGLDNLTSLDFCIYINGTASCTLQWTGDLAYLESEIVVFPEVTFTIEPENILTVEAEDPNGQPDDYLLNNSFTINMDEAQNVVGPVSLIMLLDDNPEETSWEVLDSQGNMLYEGGPYDPSASTVVEQFDLGGPDCYSFIIYDEGGNGLSGGGVYKLYEGNNNIFYQNNNFRLEDHVQFGIGLTNTEELIVSEEFEIYPNPVRDIANISFELEYPGTVQYKVYNYAGAVVLESNERHFGAGIQTISIATEQINSGIYIVEFKTAEAVMTKQIVVNK